MLDRVISTSGGCGVCLALALVGCKPDTGIQVINAFPEATITSHQTGDEVWDGYAFIARATVTDNDHDPEHLVTDWYVEQQLACDGVVPEDDGTTSCELVLDADEAWISVEVRDPENANARDEIDLTVLPTEAPTATIVLPETNGIYYSDVKVTFQGSVADNEDDPDALVVWWESDQDGALSDVDPTVDSGGEVLGFTTLTEGQHAISIVVEDSSGKPATDSVVIDVGPPNSNPTCEISAPEDSSTAEEGEVLTFRADVGDEDVDADWLTVDWESDKHEELLGSSVPTSSGEVVFTTSDLSTETHTVTMRVTDEVGATCTDLVVVTIGVSPALEIVSPASGTVVNHGETVSFEATVTDAEDAPDEVELEWSSSVDGVLSSESADSSGTARLDVATLTAGTHTITLSATDTDGFDTTDSLTLRVNETPSAPVVSISPNAPESTDSLTAAILTDAVDPEGETITYSYEWEVGGVVSTASTTSILSSSDTTKGEIWSVNVTPNDGTGDGDVGTATVLIENAAPSVSAVEISPNPATVDDTLTCGWSGFSDPDGDDDLTLLEWSINGASAGSDATLTESFEKGDVLMCTVTPYDGEDVGAVISDSLTVGNSAPAITSVTITPASAMAGDTLTCDWSGFTDADDDLDQSTVEWAINGTTAGTSTTLSSGFVRDDVITCTVTPFDGTDTGTAVSETLTISNTAPSITSVSITPTSPTASDTLLCSWSGFSDDDGDADSSSVEWAVNGSSAGTSLVLSGVFVRDDVVVCTVTPSDGTDTGIAVSETIRIENSAPSVSAVSISPSAPQADDVLSCEWSGFSDADGDDDVSTAVWSVSGTDVATGPTLSGGFAYGDTVTCTVTPSDGVDEGTPQTASAVVENTAPELSSVTLTPTDATEADTLVCTPGTTTDADGTSSFTYTTQWKVSGGFLTVTTDTLDAVWFQKDDTVSCLVTPNDGTDDGTTEESNTITVENALPEVSSVSLSPSTVYTDDTLFVSVTADDLDGDAVSLTYTWMVDGAAASTSASSLDGGLFFDKGQIVSVTVTPNDGTDDGEASESASVTILNTAPEAPVVAIDPQSPREAEEDLICVIDMDSYDVDGDAISYVFEWTEDGSSFTDTETTEHEGDTVPLDEVDEEEEWVCTVTPFDGESFGASTSDTVTVRPTFSGWSSTTPSLSTADYVFIGEDASDNSGYAVVSPGDVDGDGLPDLLIGANGDDDGGSGAGAAYLVYAADLGTDNELDLADFPDKLTGVSAGDNAGRALARIGDVDSDGLADLLVGAQTNDSGGSDAGATYIVTSSSLTGSSYGLSSSTYSFIGESSGDNSGCSIAGLGDMDGDGLEDLLIGAYANSTGGSSSGAAYIVMADSFAAALSLADADYRYAGEASDNHAGFAVAGPGDMDGDGDADAVVAAHRNDDNGHYSGKVYVLYADDLSGSSTTLATADTMFLGEESYDGAGYELAGAGDVDADGLGDLMVGAYANDEAASNAGKSYVILASSLTTGTLSLSGADYGFLGEASNDQSGLQLGGAGDVDGDGFDDLLFGAPANDESYGNGGQTYLYLAASLSAGDVSLDSADYGFRAQNASDYTGWSVTGVGDVNGDTLDDFVTASTSNDDGGSGAGKTYLLLSP